MSHQGSPFFVSQTTLEYEAYKRYLDSFTSEWNAKADEDGLTLIRCTLMHPFFDSKDTNVNFLKEFVKEVGKQVENLLGY